MKRIRIKKDFNCSWSILTNGEASSLSGRSLSLILVSPKGTRTNLEFGTSGNTLKFAISHTAQTVIGVYRLELWQNKDTATQTILDRLNAFELVRFTPNEGGEDDNNLKTESLDLGTSNFQTGAAGSGTTNYNDLTNKPQIAGTELTGDKSLDTLGIAAKTHNHDGVYATSSHNHDGVYASASLISDVENDTTRIRRTKNGKSTGADFSASGLVQIVAGMTDGFGGGKLQLQETEAELTVGTHSIGLYDGYGVYVDDHKVVTDDDSRLTDARTPLAHTHSEYLTSGDITGKADKPSSATAIPSSGVADNTIYRITFSGNGTTTDNDVFTIPAAPASNTMGVVIELTTTIETTLNDENVTAWVNEPDGTLSAGKYIISILDGMHSFNEVTSNTTA